jgi:poly-gamma-glutamate synthesis protein (capsule biosynthesis protein)
MNLLLVGDIVCPSEKSIDIRELIPSVGNMKIIGNLEGALLPPQNLPRAVDDYKYNLFSYPSFSSILKRLKVTAVSLANNHFCDFNCSPDVTTKILEQNSIEYFGLTTKKWLFFSDGPSHFAIYGTSTYITGSKKTQNCAINTFHPSKTLKEIQQIRSKHPKAFIIIFIHWGYELSYFPQPADREWAKKAIDCGANAIIGHHPHVVQGIEEYKGGIIAYSLGNFILPQVLFGHRLLWYKTKRVRTQLGIEIDLHTEEKIKLHWFFYDKERKMISYRGCESMSASKEIASLTPFNEFEDKYYLEWFKAQKAKLRIENNSGRYPTYDSYRSILGLKYRFFDNYVYLLRLLRRFAICSGLHRPYNWK